MSRLLAAKQPSPRQVQKAGARLINGHIAAQRGAQRGNVTGKLPVLRVAYSHSAQWVMG